MIERLAWVVLAGWASGLFWSGGALAVEPPRPNILLIVADDLGYSDLACFGGDLDTPSLDRLAQRGSRFTNAMVNPMCVVTRTSLLTGQTHTQSNNHRNSHPIAAVLRDCGYRTSISGKWHQPGNPLDAGFEHFYGFLGGEINSWHGTANGTPVIQTDRDSPMPVPPGWYASDAFSDDCISQIDAAVESKKPFFCYLAFNAPHGPHHAPRRNVAKYAHRFDAGWDVMRRDRHRRMVEEGIIDEQFQLSEPEAEVQRWNELPRDVQRLESRRFQAYAGMVDRMDETIGRVLDHLDSLGIADNTLVIFFSDNGGDYGHGDRRGADREVPWSASGPRPAHANGWAMLKATPFRWYKSSAFQGGVATPLIVAWPQGLASAPGSIMRQRVHVTDWYPTFLELAGAAVPEKVAKGSLGELMGHSLVPIFKDPSLPELAVHNRIIWEYEGVSKGLLRDHWKIVSINDGPWRLFDIATDPSEAHDLAAEQPQVCDELSREWFAFEEQFPWNSVAWRQPLRTEQQGWGLHRLQQAMPVVSMAPAMAATDVPLETTLQFEFTKKPAIPAEPDASFRLYSSRDPSRPVYVFRGRGEGVATIDDNTVTLSGLPTLRPDTTYFVLADAGWITVAGKPVGPINDGSVWYRFRTCR